MAVEYTMDPRNFLNEVRIFQFEKLSYDSRTNNKEGIERILYGTEFYKKNVTYRTDSGQNITMNETYADLIWNAGVYSGVSPYHLASRIRQEVGPFISHSSISGNVAGFEGLYNFYNIGATSSTEIMGAIKNGLQFAKDGKGASDSVKANLLLPWDNPEKAITGGAVFIGSSYINVGQNNLYLQKFDVNDDRSSNLFWHQYMTNCLAPYNESSSIYKAYNSNGMLSSDIGFVIPVYNNMSEYATSNPNILASDYQKDETKVYGDVIGSLNVRTGPSTAYEILTSVTRDEKLIRIQKGIQNGERWDKVLLENGIVGYVFQSYIKEIPKPSITKIVLNMDNNTLNKGTTSNINLQIEPEEAKEEQVIWKSDDESIITVENGIVTAISSGSTTITASSLDGSVYGQIAVNVYSPVIDIILVTENIEMLQGTNTTIRATVLPEDATDKKLIWSSSNIDIVEVDQTGIITAKSEGTAKIIVEDSNKKINKECNITVKSYKPGQEINFNNSLKIDADAISGIEFNKNTVKEIKSLVETNLNIEIYGNNNEILPEDKNVGTGCKLVVKDENGNVIYNYVFVMYGDVNGDGLINSLDSLVVQKHILEIKLIKGIFLKSGNTLKNGNLPSSLDVLRIQKHILETKFIEQ